MRKIGVLTLALSCLLTDVAFAQEPATRAEADRKRREEKEAQTTPYVPNGVERAIKFAETRGIFILDREGFYPKLGSLTVGSGFAYGLGFRNRKLFENTGALDLWAAASIRRYNAVEARLTFPRLAGNHLYLETWGSRRDYPQENFFGLGPDSSRADRSDYGIRTNHAGGRAGIRPVDALLIGGGLEYLQPRLGPGNSSRLPDVSDTFETSELPGFEAVSNFLRSDAFIEVDYREPRNARQGGWYRLDYSHYDDRKTGTYTFNRLDADVRQFIGFLAGRRVIATRLFVATSDATDENAIPFYYMPTLGGNDTLRGFRQYRFQAPHAILFQGEYRWEIWSGLDGAIFYDTGKVANRRSDLDFSNLERDYGFGFRFNTDNGVVFRVDAAFGSRDGKHLHIVFGGIF
jgi:surface antigen Omp85-like protein